jgi:hypothetical protein
VAIAALVAACALPAASSSAASSACRSASQARGTKIVSQGKLAVVFLPRNASTYRGCVFGGSVRKLKAICCEEETAHVGGRFAVYTYSGTAIGDETSKVGVYDLRSGKRVRFTKLDPTGEGGDPAEIETYSFVSASAVTPSGSPVWLGEKVDGDGNPTGDLELRAADGPKHTERIVDNGKISAKSVKISADGKTLTYTKDGAPQAAPLAG